VFSRRTDAARSQALAKFTDKAQAITDFQQNDYLIAQIHELTQRLIKAMP
jgi:hypothetical protein